MNRNRSTFEDIIGVSSFFPCWLSVLLAILSYYFLHQFADLTPGKVNNANDLLNFASSHLFNGFARFLQFILPIAFLLGALFSIVNTQIQSGFSATIKSLAVTLMISFATILLLVSFRPTLPPHIVHGSVFQKISESLLFQKKDNPPLIEQTTPTRRAEDYVFSEKEISNVKEKLMKDRQENSLFEIQLNSGRSIFAKNPIIKGDILSFENDSGLVVSMSKDDVSNVRKVIQK